MHFSYWECLHCQPADTELTVAGAPDWTCGPIRTPPLKTDVLLHKDRMHCRRPTERVPRKLVILGAEISVDRMGG